jgi:transposase
LATKTHAPYPAEFKAEAVRLVRTSGQTLRATAEHLGVSVEALREWVKQGAIDTGEREGLTTEERAELSRLRRENHVLRMERDILKKAAAFFARESESR